MSRPVTFAKAIQTLGDSINYDVKIGDSEGALMSRAAWLESVESGMFIDYDGFGDQVTAEGQIIGRTRPSAAKHLLDATAYILWYNK